MSENDKQLDWIPYLDEYDQALVTLILGKAADSPGYHLVWGCIEMIPSEIHREIDHIYETKALPSSPSYRLFAWQHITEPKGALEWFDRLARNGEWVLPDVETGDMGGERPEGIPVGLHHTEPPWPGLTILTEDRRFGCVPIDLQSPSICSIWPDEEHTLFKIKESHRVAAFLWIKEQLGFEIDIDFQLIGSAHLIIGNPIIREFSVRFTEPDSHDAPGAIQVRTVLRTGKTYDDFTLMLIERRDKGWRLMYQGPLDDPAMEIRVPNKQLGEIAALLTQGDQLIYVSELHSFIRSINLSFRVLSGSRRVNIMGDTEGKSESFTVQTRDAPSLSKIGPGTTPDGLQVTRDIRRRIKRQRVSQSLDQVWLYKNRTDARSMLRKVMDKADVRVLFVDPYFGPNELMRFAAAVPCASTRIEVLTSLDWIRIDETRKHSLLVSLKSLTQVRDKIVTDLGIQSIDIRIMTGRPAEIHDRFLVCDDQIWMLGSSLNSFGSRGTMLVRLPEPEGIIRELDQVWESSTTKTLNDKITELEESDTPIRELDKGLEDVDAAET
jgi:hypothetical protein